MAENRVPVLASLLLGICLLGTGFVVGYGFRAPGADKPLPGPAPTPTPAAPSIKGLHAAPDGQTVAFTAVYQAARQSGIFLFDVARKTWSVTESPQGWQDYVTGWRADGKALLLERERIPQPAAEARAGMYLSEVTRQDVPKSGELQSLTRGLPLGNEKIVSGFLAPGGGLIIKTRTEPKALFRVQGQDVVELDRATVTYGQNRVVREDGKDVLYVVRDVPGQKEGEALFRVDNGKARQISPVWQDVVWTYVSDSGRFLLVSRYDKNEEDWFWSLYSVSREGTRLLKEATIPADVITVYWSPDDKTVVGAAGDRLWRISVPDLKVNQLGTRADWHAEDVCWLGQEQALAVAAAGQLWRVDVRSGAANLLWRLPEQYWK